MERKKISFVIPCYNTTEAIESVISEISQSMTTLQEYEYEIILVNDGSPDRRTLPYLKEVISRRKEKILLVDLAKNSGQPNAILTGMRFGNGDLFMTADDDGQTSMNYIPEFIKGIEEGKDVVCARYTSRPQKSVIRRMGTIVNNKMAKALIPRPEGIEMTTIFMAKRFVVDELIKYDQPFAYISGLILRITQNIGNVAVEQRQRQSGGSGYTLVKLIRLWANGATAFSIKPLRIADGVGVSVALIGFLMALVTIVQKLLFVNYQAGWSSIVSILLILFGINLLVLGIMGEYIGRIYISVNKAPQAVVRTVYMRENENGGQQR